MPTSYVKVMYQHWSNFQFIHAIELMYGTHKMLLSLKLKVTDLWFPVDGYLLKTLRLVVEVLGNF